MHGPSRQPGLERRIDRESRRISNQHRQLDEFYAMVEASIAAGRARRARSEFVRFQDALEAHFQVEERIHFPAVHGFRPELDAELAELVEEHRGFRAQLSQIARYFEAEDLERSAAALDDLVVDLAAHEGREERMIEHSEAARGDSESD